MIIKIIKELSAQVEVGGSHTRYDYESWHWRIEIRLKIKNAIMFKGERK